MYTYCKKFKENHYSRYHSIRILEPKQLPLWELLMSQLQSTFDLYVGMRQLLTFWLTYWHSWSEQNLHRNDFIKPLTNLFFRIDKNLIISGENIISKICLGYKNNFY